MDLEKLKIKNLLDLNETIAKDLFLQCEYPWEVLPHIKDFIMKCINDLSKDSYNEIAPNVWAHKEAVISDSAYIAGPTIICENAEIRHCAFIRGSAIIGKGSVVGNSTEVKNSIIFNNAQCPHYNYVGDSIIGYKAHMGAGAITSNLKSDRTDVGINIDGEKFDTKLHKFGAILGDNVEIGCNSVLNPGSVIGKNTNVYPLSFVRGYVKENGIYKRLGEVVEKR